MRFCREQPSDQTRQTICTCKGARELRGQRGGLGDITTSDMGDKPFHRGSVVTEGAQLPGRTQPRVFPALFLKTVSPLVSNETRSVQPDSADQGVKETCWLVHRRV